MKSHEGKMSINYIHFIYDIKEILIMNSYGIETLKLESRFRSSKRLERRFDDSLTIQLSHDSAT